MTACPSCGAAVKAGKKFCGLCGAKLETAAVLPSPSEPPAPVSAPAPAPAPAPPPKPKKERRTSGIDARLEAVQSLFGPGAMPRWTLGPLLGFAFFFWPAGFVMALLLRPRDKHPALLALSQLTALTALAGALSLTLLGMKGGVALLVLFFLGLLAVSVYHGLGSAGTGNRKIGVAMAVGAVIALMLTALIGTGQAPFLARFGHPHIDFLFSTWMPREAPPAPSPSPGKNEASKPLDPAAVIDSMSKNEVCESILVQLNLRWQELNDTRKLCATQFKMRNPSPKCHTLPDLEAAYRAVYATCLKNECVCSASEQQGQ